MRTVARWYVKEFMNCILITKFDILLTVLHLDVMLVNNQLDALFSKCIYFYFYTSTCFEQQLLIIRRFSRYQYTIWYNIL